jgi:hypothetical protein
MLEEERTKRMNELEKMAKKHKKKQKYPMSIFPDYKKGAEEFNKNSTPLNQDALSSADASSGMAEDIERNKKKGINEEMDDFLNWEIAEPQCTGYDCGSNIEYVYGDNDDRVWIEEDGKKYKVYVNQWDTKPTATFTSLKKAKAFGEKYWQDNYGYIDESLNEGVSEKDILIQSIIEEIYNVYNELKELPKPSTKRIGGTYYGSTQLFSSVGNHLDLIEDEDYTSYGYGGSTTRYHCYYIRYGGAYGYPDCIKNLKNYIREHAAELRERKYTMIDDYGTNFSTIGIGSFDRHQNESLSEEYIPDLTQRYPEGFDGESAYRTPWDDEYRAWDDLSRQQKEEEEEFERLKKSAKYKLIREYDDGEEEDYFQTKQDALNSIQRLCDTVYRYIKNGHEHPLRYLSLENIKTGKSKKVPIEDMIDYYYGTAQTNESLNERFSNGTLAEFDPQDLMDKVKSRLEAINTIRTNGNNLYMISIHPHRMFARLSPETEYDIYIVEEDADGNQRYVSTYDEFSKLLDTEVVDKLNEWKNSAVSVNESLDNDDYDRPVMDKSNRVVNSLISNLNSSGFEVEDYEIKDNDIVVRFYDDISDRNFGFLRRSFSGPTKAFSSVTALNDYKDDDGNTTYNNMIFELRQ